MRVLQNIFLLLSVSLLLNACMGGGGADIPRDHYYRLPAVAPITPRPAPQLPGTLEVTAIQTSGMLHERAILFVREQQPLEVSPYHYYFWVNAPTSLIQQHLLAYLQQKNLAHSQHRYRSDTPADFRLEGELFHFERYLRGDAAEAQVELELLLRDNRSQRILVHRRYRQNITAASMNMADTANAFGQALTAIYQQFSNEVANLNLP